MGFTSVTILNSSSRSTICDGGTLFLTNVPLAEPAANKESHITLHKAVFSFPEMYQSRIQQGVT